MNRILREQLERIHRLNYGNKVIKEGFLDTLLGGNDGDEVKKIDDPKKADLVGLTDKKQKISDDKLVFDFYKTLDDSIESGGLKQQDYGTMTFQKGVETMQIGLLLLGYDLPTHGVDGLFGPETAAAVRKFKESNSILNEDASELRGTLSSLGYNEKSNELTSGGDISDELSGIVSDILKSYKNEKPNVKVTVTSGNDKFHKSVGYQSKHSSGQAVDLVIQPYNSENANAFISILDSYKSKDSNFNYIDEYKNPSSASTGGHFHLQYGKGEVSNVSGSEATPEMLGVLKELLKQKGVQPQDIKQYVDPVTTGGGEHFTDLDIMTSEGFDNYAKICDSFISKRQPNPLGITGKMMASSARKAFERYQRYVPAELALAQLAAEGGIGNPNLNSRPIKTKNPFNVGNVDSGDNVYKNTVQEGIDSYYNLIAKDYLGKGKTAADLTKNFVNKQNLRYAGPKYESSVSALAREANRVAKNLGIS
jgi:peptidoglycan hydrolase-like protein with peptidoglycan-binding domain